MNDRVQVGDPFESSVAFWRQLGPADRCRVVDHMLAELGPVAPIPQFEDIRSDAVWWMQSVPENVRTTYLAELFCELPPERQAAFLAWAEKNKKGGGKAEAPGG